MRAYYNEIDPYAAQWLRNLIIAGHIAPGDVDERSIEDVRPDDLLPYTQCHFFAGIGVWSHALRLAGWDDTRPVWTGSCPCQPFSAAGKGAGFADERHLWPSFFHLISERRPDVVFGEQVSGGGAKAWVDLVQDDLEALGFVFGAAVAPACGFGAPHMRERLYWAAYSERSEEERQRPHRRQGLREQEAARPAGGGVVDGAFGNDSRLLRSGDAEGERRDGRPEAGKADSGRGRAPATVCETNGFWSDVKWLPGIDGRWRPTQPGLQPVAYGVANRVGKLRAYGNAIVAPQATEFIKAAMRYRP